MYGFKLLKLRFIVIAFAIFTSFYLGTYAYLELNSENNFTSLRVGLASEFIEKVLNDGFEIRYDNKAIEVDNSEIKEWLETYIRQYSGNQDVRLKSESIREYIESVAPLLSIEPTDAGLQFINGKVEIINPEVKGRRVNIDSTVANISKALVKGLNSSNVSFQYTDPDITLEKISSLGINTLLGKGESDFSGSPSSRVHNIKIGTARYNGVIVGLGEEFSFNDLLGEVDAKSGYEAELVIKNGGLVREYGGGLCQVSTTVFRAAIDSGLPINERRPHSFPVRYYDPQGFDSTIYPGVVDLKFTNDTPGHILIQGKIDGNKLLFEIYGSSDGREVTIEGPYQYYQGPDGSLKAYLIRKVAYGDEAIEERFDSSYRPPPSSRLERNPLE